MDKIQVGSIVRLKSEEICRENQSNLTMTVGSIKDGGARVYWTNNGELKFGLVEVAALWSL